MKQDWLDKKLNDRLQGLDSEMNFSDAWQRIENQRNKKKRRIIFFWLTGFAFFVSSALVTAFYFSENKKQAVNSSVPGFDISGIVANTTLENKSPQKSNIENAEPENTSLSFLKEKNDSKTITEKTAGKPIENSPLNTNNHSSFDYKNPLPSISIKQAPLSTISNKTASPTPNTNISPAIEKQTPKALAPLDLFVIQNESSNKAPSVAIDHLPVNAPPQKTPKNGWGATISYGYFFRSLNATSANRKDWIDRRLETEKTLDAVYADVFFRKYISLNLFLQTGVGYLQHTTRLEDYFENNDWKTMDGQLVQIIRRPDGTEEEIYGESEVFVTEKNSVIKYQKNRSVLLPVLFGIDVPVTKKSGFTFSLGAAVSIATEYSGLTISENGISGNYVPIEVFSYKKRGLFYGQGNAAFYFDLNKKWKVSGGLQTMVGLNNQVEEMSGIEEKFRYVGGRIAILNSF
ncbi:MAG: hypothetical protein AAFZ15_32790 [Bacteroidota bacterium]